ncbi:transposase [Streptomyces sp. MMS24-I29]|uniref:transposase n=1 Tax=Streptomyces sp. MMS24-I29 TaxID=3351480 RepID=UPI003C79EAF9
MRDRLDGLWRDEDFTAWYPRDGRPGLSPAQLATVCVLQFLLGLSDRQAAEAVRCRIDFKYAMAMELEDPGFHHSVLTDFRDRLAEDGRADRLLDLALMRRKEAGLVRERTMQRTDSTHVLAAVHDLTCLELIAEALRAALEEIAGISPHLLDGLVDEDWGLRYGRPVRLGKNPTKPMTRILATGHDAVRLLEHLYRHGADRASGPRVQALLQIMMQNYHRDAAGRLRWRTAEKEGGAGLPPSSRAIVSSYDTSARYARHGHIISWKGFAAYLTETCAPDSPNVITDVATTHDSQVLPCIHTRLARRGLNGGGCPDAGAFCEELSTVTADDLDSPRPPREARHGSSTRSWPPTAVTAPPSPAARSASAASPPAPTNWWCGSRPPIWTGGSTPSPTGRAGQASQDCAGPAAETRSS